MATFPVAHGAAIVVNVESRLHHVAGCMRQGGVRVATPPVWLRLPVALWRLWGF